MTVSKGLRSLVENTPNFSNQALENAINQFKIGWVLKSFQLDSVIESNAVLTTSQKTDIKEEINNLSHINIGRVLGDLLRHTNTILDGSIIPGDPGITGTLDNGQGTYLEMLQSVQGLQYTIPNLFGVIAKDKNRGVNDHFGTLNQIFSETEDSTAPVFTTLNEAITFINNAGLSADTALQTAYDNLKNFINSVVADSTDFQQTLDTFSAAVATAHTNLNNALASEPYLSNKTKLIETREKINAQVSLENSNLSGIRTFLQTLSNSSAFSGLAEDAQLRKLMVNTSQNASWKTYFEEYVFNALNINTSYATATDSDKSSVIEQVLASLGLPDVLDSTDLAAVAAKAQRDTRIDTANYDRLTVEQQITKSCEQLGITTTNRTITALSGTLLRDMNQHDRNEIARQLDSNESANTLS
jgi:hypothetical protein|tara:strand:- start:1767 stop:3011 length:1245 start_codon:yes stop_codon:yes gene_type:complete